MLLEESLKAKRSTGADMDPNCHKFNYGNGVEKEFYSPGYPNNYTKNVTCIHVIEGETKKKTFPFIKNE